MKKKSKDKILTLRNMQFFDYQDQIILEKIQKLALLFVYQRGILYSYHGEPQCQLNQQIYKVISQSTHKDNNTSQYGSSCFSELLNPLSFLKGVQCDNNTQSGPILTDVETTEEQIQDRSFQIYDLFIDNAKKKHENHSYKIGNMIVLSNEDVAILISNNFLSLQEYIGLYIDQINVDKQQELNYPCPPCFFDVMQFLEVENYQNYRGE